jgi:hypothetical protein
MVYVMLFSMLKVLFFYISIFRSMLAVPTRAVFVVLFDLVFSRYTAQVFDK